jgi:hypothetical protein
MKKLIRNEKGQALILALILLAVGGLILAPLLAYMRTGLTAGEVCEVKTNELYAADAGVEDAVWKIQNQIDIPTGCYLDTTRSYNITDVNGKKVAFNITRANNVTLTYLVESIATGDGSGTKIDAYITGKSKYADYSGILEHVITSWDELELPNNPNVVIDPPVGQENGPVGDYRNLGAWPDESEEVAELAEFYKEQVKNARHYSGDTTIDLNGNGCPPGPAYVNGVPFSYASGLEALYIGGTLTIENSINPQATLSLNGTLYVEGNVSIKPTKELILDLHGNTIFVEGNFEVDKSCGVMGPGAIIVIGDITFKPGIQAGGAGPVFVMSVSGTTHFEPSVNFYGSIAGKLLVDIDPSAHMTITYPDNEGWYKNLNFLIGIKKLVYVIASWEVSPL